MATYWATECLPMAVTSLLPMVLFPLLGVLKADVASRNYFQDKIVLFFGGLVIAAALELVELHRRIALRVLLLFGAKPPQLLLGFMVATAFVSMWMSNTATAAMMMPIAEAVLHQLERAAREAAHAEVAAIHTNPDEDATKEAEARAALRFKPLGKAMVLSIAYAANIGGMATLTGTGPNLVLAGDISALYPKAPGLSFASWILFGLPLSLLLLLAAWGLLCVTMLRGSSKLYQPSRVRSTLRQEYQSLGRMSSREALVLCDFVLLALLWITRDPKFVPGWGALFKEHFVTDGTVAALMASILFALPAEPVALIRGGGRRMLRLQDNDVPREVTGIELESTTRSSTAAAPNGAPAVAPSAATPTAPSPYTALLDWNEVQKVLPWHVILLLGGGFALADGCVKSGLSQSVGENLAGLRHLPPTLVSFLLLLIVSATTAVTSNVATASIFLPVVSGLAQSMGVHPLSFMIPTALTTSLAFVLPVSTPPNAMAFASGRLEVKDMVGLGLVMNAIGIAAVLFFTHTVGLGVFQLGGEEVPEEWLAGGNATERGPGHD